MTLAASNYSKRLFTFTTGVEADHLTAGQTISVSTSDSGIPYGYSGRIESFHSQSITVKHYSVPGFNQETYNSNTGPWILKTSNVTTGETSSYVVSNPGFSRVSVAEGFDTIRFNLVGRFENGRISRGISGAITGIGKDDLWSLGELVGNQSTGEKLIKITSITQNPDGKYDIGGQEYVSAIYTDSERFIDSKIVEYTRRESPYLSPPIPTLSLDFNERRNSDGTIYLDSIVNEDTNYYKGKYKTQYKVAYPASSTVINAINKTATGATISTLNNYNTSNVVSIMGKAGFSGIAGTVPLLCHAKEVVADPSNSLGLIKLSTEGLNSADSAGTAIARVGSFITFPIVEKVGTDRFTTSIRNNKILLLKR